jgi:hypothetical protein
MGYIYPENLTQVKRFYLTQVSIYIYIYLFIYYYYYF